MLDALSVKNLSKTYPDGFKALDAINFSVKKGEFCALLGPNGAGKSTTINIITTLLPYTTGEGEVFIFSHNIKTEPTNAKKSVGLVPQEFNFNLFERVKDIVLVQASYYGVKRSEAKKRMEYYLKKLNLWDKRNDRARTLSGGMKRRLMIARALIHEPQLLILDEPTAGVDIELRRSMWDFLKEINREKKITIILTTHYLEEAENLCNQIIIINNGNIVENTDKSNLLKMLEVEHFIITPAKALSVCPQIEGYSTALDIDGNLDIGVSKGKDLNTAFDLLSKQGIHAVSMRNKHNRLEELFLQYTNKR